jgi:asparagine synthase (glutamine-hydrolysing)
MCGIAGTYNCGNREVLSRMAAVQFHRGPDDGGIWDTTLPDGAYVGLACRRLAIQDISPAGHMPMSNDDEKLWITYNGEVYNFPELRLELESRGLRFRSRTDTEVILRLYEREGPAMLSRLNGMFAIAIFDLRQNPPTLFLARDHFGVKPLYYKQAGGWLAFASEVKALLEVPGIEAEFDDDSLLQYLTFLWVPDPKTIFRGIYNLPAGHYALWRGTELKLVQYWDLRFREAGAPDAYSEQELVEGVRERLARSVKAQMISDVPLGAFLSAGMDSSSIVAVMSRASSDPVRTYTITFPKRYRIGEQLDDPRVAARLASKLGCYHHEIVVEPHVADLLPKLIWHMDEPTADPAVIPAYLVSHEARNSVTVLLSGVGGDELFAGYRKHAAHGWAQLYRRIPRALRRVAEGALSRTSSLRGTGLKSAVRLLKKMARSASLSPEAAFLTNCTYLSRAMIGELCQPELVGRLADFDPWARHLEHFRAARRFDFLDQMLYLDTKTFMVSLNLTYNDKMSMAASVEVRVPFLDRELVEFAAQNIPPRLKLRGSVFSTTKYILRQAMKDVLPEEVLGQPKAGFAAPVDYWLAHDLREMVGDLLAADRVARRGIFRHEGVQRLIDEQRRGDEDWSMQIWQLLTLELWMQAFLDKKPHRQPAVAAGAARFGAGMRLSAE